MLYNFLPPGIDTGFTVENAFVSLLNFLKYLIVFIMEILFSEYNNILYMYIYILININLLFIILI